MINIFYYTGILSIQIVYKKNHGKRLIATHEKTCYDKLLETLI
jgi:hypothetical protein